MAVTSLEEQHKLQYDDQIDRFLVMERKIITLQDQLIVMKAETIQQTQQNHQMLQYQNSLLEKVISLTEVANVAKQFTGNDNGRETNIHEDWVHVENNDVIEEADDFVLVDNNNTVDTIDDEYVVVDSTVTTAPVTLPVLDNQQDNNTLPPRKQSRKNLSQRTVNDLRSEGRKPTLRPQCPDTWLSLLAEWEVEQLGSLEHSTNKGDWLKIDRSRFALRVRYIAQIRRRAKHDNCTLEVAALTLDRIRNERVPKITLRTHLDMECALDPSVKKRTRK